MNGEPVVPSARVDLDLEAIEADIAKRKCETPWGERHHDATMRLVAAVPALVAEVRRLRREVEHPDVYELLERGLRVLDDDQCCELGCSGGACESCPCCSAGWCVAGHSGEIPNPTTDAENYAIWLDVSSEHNPVAKRLSEVEAERDAARAEAEELRQAYRTVCDYAAQHDATRAELNEARAEAERLREEASEEKRRAEQSRSVAYQRLVEDRDKYLEAWQASVAEAARVREALQAIRDLHQPDDTPDELIWLGDGPCPDCGADNDERECEGHPTICCRHCQQQHPEDSMLVSPVPWPCATVRALDAALDGAE